MSGGQFDYIQYRFESTADEIEPFILNNGNPELDQYGYKKHRNFSPEVVDKFKEAIILVKQAAAYVHCIDYLVCDDYGEESFLEQLERRLNAINTSNAKE